MFPWKKYERNGKIQFVDKEETKKLVKWYGDFCGQVSLFLKQTTVCFVKAWAQILVLYFHLGEREVPELRAITAIDLCKQFAFSAELHEDVFCLVGKQEYNLDSDDDDYLI